MIWIMTMARRMNGVYAAFMLVAFMMGVAGALQAPTLSLFLSREVGAQPFWIGLFYTVNAIAVIFRQLTSSELSLYQQSPYNPLYIRISLYPEVNRYHPISSCFWGYFRGYYFLLKYQHPHNGKNVIYNNDF
ncbi:broad specificity sugar efflux system SetA [Escherichia coli]|nr:broad specificity sugar efflux system SetA [Escherichia coli]